MRSIFRTLALSAGLFLFSVTAFAGPATDLLKAKQTALVNLLKAKGSDKNISAIFDELLDYDTIARESLGKEWEARSDAEKKEFSELLKTLVRKSYERNLKKTLSYEVEYLSEEAAEQRILVKTKAVNKAKSNEEPVEIAYTMAAKGDTWQVQDITTEGVSLVRSYRNQFTKIVKKDGFPALIRKMKDKVAKGD